MLELDRRRRHGSIPGFTWLQKAGDSGITGAGILSCFFLVHTTNRGLWGTNRDSSNQLGATDRSATGRSINNGCGGSHPYKEWLPGVCLMAAAEGTQPLPFWWQKRVFGGSTAIFGGSFGEPGGLQLTRIRNIRIANIGARAPAPPGYSVAHTCPNMLVGLGSS